MSRLTIKVARTAKVKFTTSRHSKTSPQLTWRDDQFATIRSNRERHRELREFFFSGLGDIHCDPMPCGRRGALPLALVNRKLCPHQHAILLVKWAHEKLNTAVVSRRR